MFRFCEPGTPLNFEYDRVKEVNFAKIQKQKLEGNIISDERAIQELQNVGVQLVHRIESSQVAKEQLVGDIQRHKENMDWVDKQIEDISREMTKMQVCAHSALQASGLASSSVECNYNIGD
mmetsp:Transcript_32152/g.85772  ORF Transcript_32152/g.85772 Transcript_32152/m.85772 type:complete len:121 (-) Transcript_32152:54-416(-)